MQVFLGQIGGGPVSTWFGIYMIREISGPISRVSVYNEQVVVEHVQCTLYIVYCTCELPDLTCKTQSSW